MDHSVRFRWRGASKIPSAELLRECGQKLTDRNLWAIFQERFQRPIFLYLLRALKYHSKREDVEQLVADLAQEVYVRLVQNEGRVLRSFRGDSDISVMGFFARVCTGVVTDYLRREFGKQRSRDNVVSFEEVREMAEARETCDRDKLDFESIISVIDIERVIAKDPDVKNGQRNALIFQLHYKDGLTAKEIAGFPVFDLNTSGVEAVLVRLRKRIRR
jgi:RNA polymerase sigma factor (sigma-70 family)